MVPVSMAAAYAARLMVWLSVEVGSATPPVRKFVPRVGEPGSVAAGHPEQPYFTAVASPVDVHPGVATGAPSSDPTPCSPSPLTIKFAVAIRLPSMIGEPSLGASSTGAS